MAYKLNNAELNSWLDSLWQTGRVYGPINLSKKGTFSDTDRTNYGEIRRIEDLSLDVKSYLSPKELAFPTRETLFYFEGEKCREPEREEGLKYVFLRACDLNGFMRLDNIFIHNGPYKDPYYMEKRDRLRFILIGCPENGFDTCFCVSMGTNTTNDWDASIKWTEDGAYINVKNSERVSEIRDALDKISGDAHPDFEFEFVKENKVKVDLSGAEQLDVSVFSHPLWTEYTERCIACGRCNTSCITCSCFTMQDIKYTDVLGERRRRWASCQVKGYSDMAGGHSFRGTNGEKMRFKTMHKVNDYKRRFGVHMCVGCGRCDDVCPEYISFAKCINKLTEIKKLEEAKND